MILESVNSDIAVVTDFDKMKLCTHWERLTICAASITSEVRMNFGFSYVKDIVVPLGSCKHSHSRHCLWYFAQLEKVLGYCSNSCRSSSIVLFM